MIYSQRDPKWAKETLGFGKTTLGSHGCFVTSLAIMCGKTPSEVNSILKKGKFFNGDLIISSNAMANSLGLTYVGKIDSQPKFKTIAEVDMSPAPGKQQHFVVVKEDGSIIDPWTGTIRPKGTYPIMSYRLFNVLKAPQVPKEEKKRLETIVDPVPEVVQEVNKPQENPMTGYRTIISAVLAFVVTMGAISQGEADQLTEGVLAILSLVTLVSTIYFRVKAKK